MAAAHSCPCPLLQVLAKLPHLAGVLVTAGDKGAAYCFAAGKANHSGRVPVFDVKVADTTGAGAQCCADTTGAGAQCCALRCCMFHDAWRLAARGRCGDTVYACQWCVQVCI
jgi:hypothetical protein